MPGDRTNASVLLKKAYSQLRGERVPLKTKEEDELATYLNSLTQKTQQARTLSFEDHGDISISSGADARRSHSVTPRGGRRTPSPAAPTPASSKFLKKKKTQGNDLEAQSDKDQRQQTVKKNNEGIVISGGRKTVQSQQAKTSSALDKANAWTNKIQGRASGGPLRRQVARDSESEDSERISELGKRPGSADTSIGRDGPKFLKNRKAVSAEEKRDVRTPSPQLAQRSSSVEKKRKHKRGNKNRGEIVRTLGNVYLTSDEESLAAFIHDLPASDSSAKKPQNLVTKKQQEWRKKSPSPTFRKTPSPLQRSQSPFRRSGSPFGKLSRSQSQDSDLMESMASEINEDNRGRHDSSSSDDPLNINLMDVTSLLPVSPRQKSKTNAKLSKGKKQQPVKSSNSSFKASSTDVLAEKGKEGRKPSAKSSKTSIKKSDSKSSLFENLGIHMVDELLDFNKGNDQGAEIDISDGSEIQTERSDEWKKAITRHHSESEIITELGGGSKKTVPYQGQSLVESVSEAIGEERFRDRKGPAKPADSDTEVSYSESFLSDSLSKTATPSISHGSRRKSRDRRKRSTSTDLYNESDHQTRRDHRIIMEEKRLDISAADERGGTHHWNTHQTGFSISGPYGLQYVDPTPVATHVVSADALEALTAYSPNMMALQEMMKAQLDLVKSFVDIQRRIYHSCMDGLSYDFKYTTLEDTKEYIRQNRKPRLTFKEALELVNQEEGIAT